MAGRIGRAFERTRSEDRLAFVPYLPSGYPDLEESDRLAVALIEGGADLLELGVPFSDPVADGPVIQRASQAALTSGATLATALEQAARLRARFDIPLVLMSYLNPLLRFGPARFAEAAVRAGIDGVIAVDLPPEEDPVLWGTLGSCGLEQIVLVAPTTEEARLPTLLERASGYVYAISRLGVTGGGDLDPSVSSLLSRCRGVSPLPRCLGFGLGPDTDLSALRHEVEGVVVGSRLLEAIGGGADATEREARAHSFARALHARLSIPSGGR